MNPQIETPDERHERLRLLLPEWAPGVPGTPVEVFDYYERDVLLYGWRSGASTWSAKERPPYGWEDFRITRILTDAAATPTPA